MHAGDGNVHVNIPVLSNNHIMMQRAESTVDKIMDKTIKLGGVISGEHGIGITKLKYIEPEILIELNKYRTEVDPNGIINPNKLTDTKVLEKVFTPSFNLLEFEAQILQRGSLEKLATKIATCIRCGKCKADCCVNYPQENLFYHPRNKNLAVGSIIEALIYEAQRKRTTGFELLKYLEDISDHCTLCHKCLAPCPAEIDSGEVSMIEREILKKRHYKHSPILTKLTLSYLNSQSKLYNSLFRTFVLELGSEVQRFVRPFLKPLLLIKQINKTYFLSLFTAPIPRPPVQTLRDLIPKTLNNQAILIKPKGESEKTVFYFPGCGSERLYSDISLAAIYVLLKNKTQVILPPPFLCCGFPAQANASLEDATKHQLKNTIIFNQIKEMFSYVDIDASVITCGTCKESLNSINLQDIFKAPLKDAIEFAQENGFRVFPNGHKKYLYHQPCHNSLDTEAKTLLHQIGNYNLLETDDCCSEAGTLAISRPDIANAMRNKKTQSIKNKMTQGNISNILLTNCPSCVQGLKKQTKLKLKPRHIAVELAFQLGGAKWKKDARKLIKNCDVVTL
jgi:Fe-S oxidoreductase